MTKIVQWLKAKAQKWCAGELLAEGERLRALIFQLRDTYERASAENERLKDERVLATLKDSQAVEGRLKELQQWKDRAEIAEKRAGLLTRAQKPFPVVDYEPDWTTAEATAWRQFLKSPAGQKLEAVANFQEQACNRSAVLRTEGAENNTGMARGWHNATEYFFKALTVDVAPKDDEATESANGAADIRERLAP